MKAKYDWFLQIQWTKNKNSTCISLRSPHFGIPVNLFRVLLHVPLTSDSDRSKEPAEYRTRDSRLYLPVVTSDVSTTTYDEKEQEDQQEYSSPASIVSHGRLSSS